MKQANRLRDMRVTAGLRSEHLAAELGVAVKTIHNWETSGEPKPYQVFAYAEGIRRARRHFADVR